MLELILPILLKIFGFVLDKVSEDREAKLRYLQFVEYLAEKNIVPVKLKESAESQRKRLLDGTKTPPGSVL